MGTGEGKPAAKPTELKGLGKSPTVEKWDFVDLFPGELGGKATTSDSPDDRTEPNVALARAEHYSFALRAARLATWDWDPATDQVIQSELGRGIFGKRITSGRDFFDSVLPEDRDRLVQALKRSLETGEQYQCEFRIVRSDNGELRWVEDQGQVYRNRYGQMIRMAGTMRDITERRASVARIALAEQAAKIGFYDWDIETERAEFSSGYRRMMGYSDEEFPATLSEWRELIHPDDREKAWAKVKSIFASTDGLIENEYRLRHRDGSYRRILSRGLVIRDLNGNAVRATGVHIDNTAIKEASERLEAMTAALKESNDELQHFSHVLSHDLREPLRTISSYIHLLQKRYDPVFDEEGREFLHYVDDGAARMRNYIDALLSYAKVDRQQLAAVPVDFSLILGEAMRNLQFLIEESGARIQGNSLPTVIGDRTLLTQLMQNLISNAIKFSGPHRPEIFVTATRCGAHWHFSVTDNGVGIAPYHVGRIFHMFHRVNAGGIPGAGIGLAVSKKIVERHQGKIWVESAPGTGSTFSFSLPAKTP